MIELHDPTLGQALFLATAALVAGLIDAIAGGGGLITLPALLAVGLPPHLALGTNKGQSVFGSSASLEQGRERGEVDGRGYSDQLAFDAGAGADADCHQMGRRTVF